MYTVYTEKWKFGGFEKSRLNPPPKHPQNTSILINTQSHHPSSPLSSAWPSSSNSSHTTLQVPLFPKISIFHPRALLSSLASLPFSQTPSTHAKGSPSGYSLVILGGWPTNWSHFSPWTLLLSSKCAWDYCLAKTHARWGSWTGYW